MEDWPKRLKEAEDRKAVYAEYRESDVWQGKRAGALERAGNRCQVCNSDSRLDVHHRTYERWGNEAPGDLTVLCRTCHERFHDSGGRVNQKKRSKKKGGGWKTAAVQAKLRKIAPGVYTTKEIAARVGRTPGSTGAILAHLAKRRNGVRRVSKKQWRLVHASEPKPKPPPEPMTPNEKDLAALAKQLAARLPIEKPTRAERMRGQTK